MILHARVLSGCYDRISSVMGESMTKWVKDAVDIPDVYIECDENSKDSISIPMMECAFDGVATFNFSNYIDMLVLTSIVIELDIKTTIKFITEQTPPGPRIEVSKWVNGSNTTKFITCNLQLMKKIVNEIKM
jgi:hypothetical protein